MAVQGNKLLCSARDESTPWFMQNPKTVALRANEWDLGDYIPKVEENMSDSRNDASRSRTCVASDGMAMTMTSAMVFLEEKLVFGARDLGSTKRVRILHVREGLVTLTLISRGYHHRRPFAVQGAMYLGCSFIQLRVKSSLLVHANTCLLEHQEPFKEIASRARLAELESLWTPDLF
ncbi:hypothetical protein BKA70DRAFT_1217459 [Coprinopsis sp. MPI-PUGE-AT-0042]|nr:hypothetical protein BKA70DRAFT_1217459 [Coprinopsis sp. MPI-PUGE-AT-0042]